MKANNLLYKDIVINFELTDTWEGEFVSAGISDRILQCDEDIQEREGYAADLDTDNFENDLHYAINNVEIGDSGLLSGCLYTDVDDTWEHPTMKLVSAITNHKNKSNNNFADFPILRYKNGGRVIFLNDWENSEYFTASFPTIFLFGIEGHISTTHGSRKKRMPLEV